jgi:dienelactone hydrolase
MKILLPLILLGLFWGSAYSALVKKAVDYKDGDTVLKGYLVYDNSFKGLRPGVLLVHEWWGLNPYIKKRADEIAKLGYIAFAADIYGGGQVAKDMGEAGKLSGSFSSNRPLILSRAQAGLSELLKEKSVDKSRVAAMGYCFGGGVVLELARSGADLKGAVTFHGSIATPTNENYDNLKAHVLVLHGAADPFVNAQVVGAFEDEMRKTKADWQVVLYSGAVHGFTNPDNGTDPSKGLAYNETADKRSWTAMKEFYEEIFKTK